MCNGDKACGPCSVKNNQHCGKEQKMVNLNLSNKSFPNRMLWSDPKYVVVDPANGAPALPSADQDVLILPKPIPIAKSLTDGKKPDLVAPGGMGPNFPKEILNFLKNGDIGILGQAMEVALKVGAYNVASYGLKQQMGVKDTVIYGLVELLNQYYTRDKLVAMLNNWVPKYSSSSMIVKEDTILAAVSELVTMGLGYKLLAYVIGSSKPITDVLMSTSVAIIVDDIYVAYAG